MLFYNLLLHLIIENVDYAIAREKLLARLFFKVTDVLCIVISCPRFCEKSWFFASAPPPFSLFVKIISLYLAEEINIYQCFHSLIGPWGRKIIKHCWELEGLQFRIETMRVSADEGTTTFLRWLWAKENIFCFSQDEVRIKCLQLLYDLKVPHYSLIVFNWLHNNMTLLSDWDHDTWAGISRWIH